MKALIDLLNRLSDQDWEWWPLVRLRPPQDEDISSRLVMRLTPFFGTLSGLAIAAVAGHLLSVHYLLLELVVGWVAFFVLYRISFAPAWNVRARSLRSKETESVT